MYSQRMQDLYRRYHCTDILGKLFMYFVYVLHATHGARNTKYHWKWAFIVWKKTNNWQHIVFSSKFIPLLYLFVINSNKIHNNAMSYKSIHLYISEIYLFIIDFSPCISFFIPLFSIGLGVSYFRGFLFNSGHHPKNTSSQFCYLYMHL